MNERVDAARNRARVLDAAARLFAAEGVDAVSMEEVAREAGVGKGTLYRRYADKGALSAALIDADARALQTEILRGLPSAGPDAGTRERLEHLLTLLCE
ncbi:MAG: helix-turn-helix domain-containing protein, partial [Gaiellales bacterium]